MKRKRGRPELIRIDGDQYPVVNAELNQLRSDLGTQTSDLAVLIARIECLKDRAEEMAKTARITLGRIAPEETKPKSNE